MPKLFLYKRIDGLPDNFLLNLFLSPEEEYGPLFQKVQTAPFKDMVTIVDAPEKANYLFLPHAYFAVKNKYPKYLKEAETFALAHQLPTLIFAYGDTHDDIVFSNSIILRSARYKSTRKENEIIIPAFIEDLGAKYGIIPISKKLVPVVGFAGMTYLPTLLAEGRYQAHLFLDKVKEFIGRSNSFERQGLYFRRKVIEILEKTSICELRAQKRRSFSAALSTIQGDPEVVREEFVQSIKDAHLPLVIRGNGNYSLRFFEILSLGRVPLFIDTDTPLPLEEGIDYDSFMLRVDYRDVNRLPEIIAEFWKVTSEEQFFSMQKKAREIFESKLRQDVFYKDFFCCISK